MGMCVCHKSARHQDGNACFIVSYAVCTGINLIIQWSPHRLQRNSLILVITTTSSTTAFPKLV